MFANLAQALARLMALRGGPQDLPAWNGLLQLGGVLFLIISVLRLTVITTPGHAVVQAVLSLVSLFVFVHLILRWRGFGPRFLQTATALLLTNALLGALLLHPMQVLAPFLAAIAEDPEKARLMQPPPGPVYAWFFISLWGMFVNGNIFRHALETRLGAGIGVGILYEFISFLIVSFVVGLL